MNTIKLVDIELVKEIRKYDRTLLLVGIAGIIFWNKLRKLELKVEKIEKLEKNGALDRVFSDSDFYKEYKEIKNKEKSKED